jgi:CspA family cold shock protein
VLTNKNLEMTGTIARLTDKGFGFIKPEEGDKDVFFHARSLADGVMYDDLREGETVTFEVEEGPKGPSAINVTRG